MSAITIPSTADEWLDVIREEVPTEAAHWVSLATATANALQREESPVMGREFFEKVADSVPNDIYDRESVVSSLVAAFEPDPEAPDEDAALEAEIDAALLEALPSASAWLREQRSAVVKTAAYQFGNWTAGRYSVNSTEEAVRQFARRLRREYPGVNITPDSFVYFSLMHWLRAKARGVDIKPRRNVSLSVYDIETLIVSNLDEIGIATPDTYSISRAVHGTLARKNRVDITYLEEMGKFLDALRRRSDEAKTLADGEAFAGWFMEKYLGTPTPALPTVATIGDAVDALIANEGDIEPFFLEAVRNGVLDLIDQVKEGEVDGDKMADALRLNVRSYGHQRFTGGPRTRLAAMLAPIEAVRGAGLTVEEWQTRWLRYKIRIAAVSGRYGEVNDSCSQLEAATAELDASTLRYPKGRTVKFVSEDLVLRVPVRTWSTDPSTLRSKAQEMWERMSVAERKAAVVEQKGVHVNWSAMSVK